MIIELKQVTVKAESRYERDTDESHRSVGVTNHILTLEIPLPGGKATYEFPITEGHFKSLEQASKLSEATK